MESGEAGVRAAAQVLRRGGLAAIPTETVYGLAADAYNEEACRKIFEAKGRPQDNPLIVHIADTGMLQDVCGAVPPVAQRLMNAFWPGPLSIVLTKSSRIPDAVSAGLPTVAVRMPAMDLTRRIIAAAGRPLAAPSANRSGRPSPTCAEHVLQDMDGRIGLIVDGGPCGIGVESTVVDATGDAPIILRPGDISAEQIRQAAGNVRLPDGNKDSGAPRSPGMKYAHYAPDAAVQVFMGAPDETAKKIIARCEGAASPVVLCAEEDLARYAGLCAQSLGAGAREAEQRIFALLREADAEGHDLVLIHLRDEMGDAVRDRTARAAHAKRAKNS